MDKAISDTKVNDRTIEELEAEANQLRKYLTPNQALFCSEYLKGRNATRAYLTAYPSCKSDNVAAASAARLLINVNVHKYLENELQVVRLRNSISTDNLLREEAHITLSDIRNTFDRRQELLGNAS
jgi:phage terminase small subunit